MHQHFQDILERIAEPPSWFDENGTPRYGAFSPRLTNNIYCQEVALAEIECQACRTRFKVALTERSVSATESLADAIRLRTVEYGDPPNIGCCPGGPTMTSIMVRIEEYWHQDYEIGPDWVRDARLEGPVPESPLPPPDVAQAISDAIAGGTRSLRVICTSGRNRYDLAGRSVARLAETGRVLVAYSTTYLVVAHHMLRGLVPEADIARVGRGTAKVMLARFEELGAVAMGDIASVVILGGVPKPHPRSIKERDDVLQWLEACGRDKLKAEFVLEHYDHLLTGAVTEIDVVAMVADAAQNPTADNHWID